MNYEEAGVSFDRAEKVLGYLRKRVRELFNYELGDFSSSVSFGDYLIFSTTDGVGTKLLVAQEFGIHNTVGIDLVAMNVNDLITKGAKPLMFLDYIATSKIEERVLEEIFEGILEGCRRAKTPLLGGELAEMPDFYPKGRYELVGFCVGICKKEEVKGKERVREGDTLIGLPSSGFHSNGFSLIRRVLKEKRISYRSYLRDFKKSVGEILLTPTRIYTEEVFKVLKYVKSLAHITGGGILENLPRAIPRGLRAVVEKDRIPKNPIFDWIRELGKIEEGEMFRVFNMGVGMVLISDEPEKVLKEIPDAFYLGHVERGEGLVLC